MSKVYRNGQYYDTKTGPQPPPPPAYTQNPGAWNLYWAGQQPAGVDQMDSAQFQRYGAGVWGEGDAYEGVTNRLAGAGITPGAPGTPYNYAPPQAPTPTPPPMTYPAGFDPSAPFPTEAEIYPPTQPAKPVVTPAPPPALPPAVIPAPPPIPVAQNPPGLEEPYNTGTAPSAINQLITDRAMEALQREYGYTSEEAAEIYQNAFANFDAQQLEDEERLMNLAEQYGWGGRSGQTAGAFQEYYGKRDLARANLVQGISRDIIDRRASDEAQAFQQAFQASDLVHTQGRGDFADMLSYLGYEMMAQDQEFTQTMDLLRYEDESLQRNFLNQVGISDRGVQDYFMALNTQWGQMNASQASADQGLSMLTNYLSNQELTPNALLNALSQAGYSEANILNAGINAGNYADSPYLPLITLLADVLSPAPQTNVNVTGGPTNVEAPETPDYLGGIWDILKGVIPNIDGEGVDFDLGNLKLPDGIGFGDLVSGLTKWAQGLEVPSWLNSVLGGWGITTPFGSASSGPLLGGLMSIGLPIATALQLQQSILNSGMLGGNTGPSDKEKFLISASGEAWNDAIIRVGVEGADSVIEYLSRNPVLLSDVKSGLGQTEEEIFETVRSYENLGDWYAQPGAMDHLYMTNMTSIDTINGRTNYINNLRNQGVSEESLAKLYDNIGAPVTSAYAVTTDTGG